MVSFTNLFEKTKIMHKEVIECVYMIRCRFAPAPLSPPLLKGSKYCRSDWGKVFTNCNFSYSFFSFPLVWRKQGKAISNRSGSQ